MIAIDLDRLIERALGEDLGGGDITSQALVEPDRWASARLVAREPLVVCGGEVFRRVFELVDDGTEVTLDLADGAVASASAVVARCQGHAAALLAAERTALNFMQRMSGIATVTRAFVDAAGSRMRICDTRKTMPGLRALDRYAVRCGGGHNHRNDLGSAVMIKENHIRCVGGVGEAIRRARARAPHTTRIECEVTDLLELREAIDAGADVILLDNMTIDEISDAVRTTKGRAVLEASGGITISRVRELAELGVDIASVGALTHSAPASDLSLLFDIGDG